MKKIIFSLTLFLFASILSAQEEIKQPQNGKSIVYFTRTTSVGPLIGFKVFDGENKIGTLKINNYIAHECEPGEHIFIAKSENTDCMNANIEANKIYFVEVEAKMGIVVARVKLVPLDKQDKKYEKKMKNILKLLAKEKKGEYTTDNEFEELGEEESPSKTIVKFKEKMAQNKKVTTLSSDMYFEQ